MSEPSFWGRALVWRSSTGGYHRLETEGPAEIDVSYQAVTVTWFENDALSKRTVTGGPYRIDIWALTDTDAHLLEQNHTLTMSNCTWEMHWIQPTFGIKTISNVGYGTPSC